MSSISDITRVWWRQEDQARGSLHVHIVFWVAQGEGWDFDDTSPLPGDKAILGTAPRRDACRTPEERPWRKFVLHLQRHDCQPKYFQSMGEAVEECKHGYPCSRNFGGCKIDPTTVRHEYTCECDEDERLSPYDAEWLLAWGASARYQPKVVNEGRSPINVRHRQT